MNAKQFAFMLSIAIFFALFIGLAIDAFYPSPKYEHYCNDTEYGRYAYPSKLYPEVINCSANINYTIKQEIEYNCSAQQKGFVRYKFDEKGCEIINSAFCDTCNEEFQQENNKYNRNVFYIAFILGIIAIISGITVSEVLGAGFMFGGVLTASYGIMRYFSELGKVLRVVVVLIALIILVWFGRKKFASGRKK